MKAGTWMMFAVWLVGGAAAGVGYALDWFDALTAALVVLFVFPLGAEVRSISARIER
jgi:hypothetical protein